MNKIIRNIPNCITVLNLGAGVLSIIAASHGAGSFWGLLGFQWAFLFMAMGALADFLDGFAARMLKAYSDVGKELDSLCDLVTFGVAPALTLFFLMQDIAVDPWLCWTTILIPVCAAFRLARFNIDTRQTSVFIGLPVPANAIFWIGYAALMWQGVTFLSVWYVFLCFLVVECWLMNSNIPMYSLKMKSLQLKENWPRYLLILAAGLFCFTLGTGGLLWLIIFYVLLSIAFRPKSQDVAADSAANKKA
ncbi:MAG: CDP-diacylglycerol--serine O-phosphatidyltransferase [Muribaculaceae bacterium]|nr:CDP-diacylglycerol--serine O-phosphatidyltransferase [Muribaculaceae bacterium]